MIDQIHISNFKCLKDVTVDLSPFTVLIGPNDSGKSSLLDAIGILGRSTRELSQSLFAPPNTLANLVWRGETALPVNWAINGVAPAGRYSYSLSALPHGGFKSEELSSPNGTLRTGGSVRHHGGPGQPMIPPNSPSYLIEPGAIRFPIQGDRTGLFSLFGGHPRHGINEIAKLFSSSTKYRLSPEAMRQPSLIVASAALLQDGSNIASVMDALLTGPDRDAIVAMEKQLHDAVETIRGVSLSVVKDGNLSGRGKTLEFALAGMERPFKTIPASLASDGVLLLTAFLSLVYGDLPEILMIEEPENGLHLSRLEQVIDLLRRISRGEVGNRPRQVLVSTHSPILLNFVRPEEVRVFRRDLDLGTQVTPMDKVPNIANYTKEFGTGELWYLLGEEKLLKGNPA